MSVAVDLSSGHSEQTGAATTTPADLVMFGEDWGGHPTSTQHLARRFARDRRIVYVNSVGMRRPRFNATDVGRLVQKVRQRTQARPSATPAPHTPPNLTVVPPLVIPWPGSSAAEAINRRLLSKRINDELDGIGISQPILWLTVPTALPAVGTLNERALVYYVADDFAALDGVDHKPVVEIEKRLVEKADLIITVSEELHSHFPPEKTVMIPHGVDVDKFATPAPRAADLPDDGRKIAGFYGAFLDRIDTDILRQAALDLPDWHFVFIGKISQGEAADLITLPNTHFFGPRPHDALPGYVQHWDVSLLPFADCAMVRSMNPLKLREYLAAGTPIATVDFPALAPYKSFVSLADPRKNFGDAIRAASCDVSRNPARSNAMGKESWEARADDISAELGKL